MDQLFETQLAIGKEFEQLVSNYKKDSESRKTAPEYFEERIRKIDDLWQKFDENDVQLKMQSGRIRTHEYFTSDYYTQVKTHHAIFRKTLSTKLEELQRTLDASADTETEMEIGVNTGGLQNTQFTSQTGAVKKQIEGNNTLSEMAEAAATQADGVKRLLNRQAAIVDSLRQVIAELDTTPTTQSVGFYKINSASLTKYWDQLQMLKCEIFENTDNPSKYGFNATAYQELTKEVHQWRYFLADKLQAMESSPSQAQQTPQYSSNSVVHLPRLEIPKFKGNYLNWMEFFDLFTELVHRHDSIADVQKMAYLKNNLEGEAAALIQHLSITAANYEVAWKLLTRRYNNKRVIIENTLQQFTDLPSIGSHSSAYIIRSFYDNIQKTLLVLRTLSIDTSSWDPILLHIIMPKLDKQLLLAYEGGIEEARELPQLCEFLKFLEKRFLSLETIKCGKREQKGKGTMMAMTSTVAAQLCKVCRKEEHPLYKCESFKQADIFGRWRLVKEYNFCCNCLSKGHRAINCKSRSCQTCNKKHNTMLHYERKGNSNSGAEKTTKGANNNKIIKNIESTTSASTEIAKALFSSHIIPPKGYVLLGTAKVNLIASNGRNVTCRALLDSGSQVNLITEKVARQLGISTKPTQLDIEGIGNSVKEATRRMTVQIHSRCTNYSTEVEAFLLPKITSPQPSQVIETSGWKIPENISLADPNFYQPGPIDLLLGAELYLALIKDGQMKIAEGLPLLQNTVFGWIVTGKIDGERPNFVTCGIFNEADSMEVLLEKFWKLENFDSEPRPLTIFERQCENHFVQTVKRDPNGRFVVRLPLIKQPSVLGDSKNQALNRFLALEQKLAKNEEIRQQYVAFMAEYEKLGHMSMINEEEIKSPNYFIPHHCVLRPESSTTKLRVVFDASARTSTKYSLNEIMHRGITVQSELFSILLRFRLPRFVFSTDIEKMYRQILVASNDQMLQLIVWRDHPKEKLKYYKLNTVTYGTRAAPYLATKCLQQLAQLSMAKHPMGANCLKENFYVDDGLAGSDNMTHALEMQQQLKTILEGAGFKLKKWCANHSKLLEGISPSDQEINLDFREESEDVIKTLGMKWKPVTDKLCLQTHVTKSNIIITKRSIVSEMARMFDPLGLIAPVVVTAKIFIQNLWKLQLAWDDELPPDLQRDWIKFRNDLPSLSNMRVDRHIFNHQKIKTVEIHTFTDASRRAYGAAVFLRAELENGCISVRLLCSKSKVAPVKEETIPRLELCAALLGAQLTQRVKTELKYEQKSTYLWSDSKVVLHQIYANYSPSDIFIANRISKIQQLSLPQQWNYVVSANNPADIISRGLSPHQLSTCNLWFFGPTFLYGHKETWPVLDLNWLKSECQFLENAAASLPVMKYVDSDTVFHKINAKGSFQTMQRVVGYICRFINNCRVNKSNRRGEKELTTVELKQALKMIIRWIQITEFEEYKILQNKRELKGSSQLVGLRPEMDSEGIIRVGGRIHHAEVPTEARHPMLCPYNHPIIKLYMEMVHKQNLHCGPQMLLAQTRQILWPIKGKQMARSVVQHCVRCTKEKPVTFQQIMGNLPPDRVQLHRPFLNSGVDYCGPFWVHYKIRGKRPHKSYIAVFCCFATKAVHLELVTDLTTEAFIGALTRFSSRRGRCKNLYCDNATNFVGTRNLLNELQELSTAIFGETARSTIQRCCGEKGIQFHFIPPRAPHFGGLWEAAVKSAKYLLHRSAKTESLTYEELETVVIEIEGILNSRPITPMSNDPNDLQALTPGHFLIGEPITAEADSISTMKHISMRKQFDAVLKIKHEFWKRWHLEYLSDLQQRHKWKKSAPNVTEGTLVIIKDKKTSPSKWPLVRIVKTYAGDDELVRVVDVKTKTGISKHAIHQLAPLFPQEESTYNAPTQSEPDEVPQKKFRTSSSSSLLIVCLCLVTLPLVLCKSMTNQPPGRTPTFCFENIGETKLTTGNWKLLIFYNLTSLHQQHRILNTQLETVDQLCSRLKSKMACETLVQQLRVAKNELQINDNFLTPKRQKRGAINIVGNIANSLFGVLDSRYAEEMSLTIEKVWKNEAALHQLLKNHTSIIDATINIMKHNEIKIKEKFDEIEIHLVKVQQFIKEMTNEMHVFQVFSVICMQMLESMSRLRTIEAVIIDIIIDASHEKINPLILSPEQLRSELGLILPHLPSNLRLPVDINENVLLYKLMRIKGGITQNQAIFEITFPLTGWQVFDLFAITAVPSLDDHGIAIIKNNPAVIGINRQRDQYFTLSQNNFKDCTSLYNNAYFCPPVPAIYEKGAEAFECVVNQLSNETSKKCSWTIEKVSYYWTPLYQINKWAYATKFPLKLTIICAEDTKQETVQGTGFLEVPANCSVKSNFLTLLGQKQFTTTTQYSFVTFNDKSIVDEMNTRSTAAYVNNTLRTYNTSINDLSALQEKVLQNDIHLNDITPAHQLGIAYTAFLLSILMIIALGYWRIRSYQQESRGPIPVPRLRFSMNTIPSGDESL